MVDFLAMCDFSQKPGPEQLPTRRKPLLPFGGARWLWVSAVITGVLATSGFAQTLRLGPMDITLAGTLEVAYDSNAEDIYPEEEIPNLQMGDFYWMPGLRLSSKSVPFFHNGTFNLAGGIAYQDYFVRNDLDTELYNAIINFQAAFMRFKVGGLVGTDYSVDGSLDEFVPGGVSRDPTLTHTANAFINWQWRKLRLETSADYTMERHDSIKYQAGDNDETTLFGAMYLDLFSWGSLYYSWEQVVTTYVQTNRETTEITKEMGLTGGIPLDVFPHPHITYSLGFEYRDEEADNPEALDGTWEPKHTIRAEDSFHLSKTITLSGYAQWENIVYEDDIGFTYAIFLTQLLGTRAQHSLSFEQEPRPTFGSTTDTETTTYGYNFGIKDLFIHHLSLSFAANYEESTPLGPGDAETENTTRLDFGLNHTRQLSRQLSRVIAYVYSYENSNFHHDGAKQKHLLTYGFTYVF